MPGTGVFLPLVGKAVQQEGSREPAEPQQPRVVSATGASGWRAARLSSSGASSSSTTTATSSRSWSEPGSHALCSSVRRLPWHPAHRVEAGRERASSPGRQPGVAAAGLFAPNAAISSAWTEQLGDATWVSPGSSPPMCLQGAGEALGAEPQPPCSMAWVTVISSAAAPGCQLVSAPAVPSGGALAPLPPALGPEFGSDASLPTWSGTLLTGSAIDSAPGCLQPCSGLLPQASSEAVRASAVDSIDAQLSALLQLREHLVPSSPLPAVPTAGPALAPTLVPQPAMLLASSSTAPAECPVSSLAQRKLQQLAAMREMEAQLQAEVAALLPLL